MSVLVLFYCVHKDMRLIFNGYIFSERMQSEIQQLNLVLLLFLIIMTWSKFVGRICVSSQRALGQSLAQARDTKSSGEAGGRARIQQLESQVDPLSFCIVGLKQNFNVTGVAAYCGNCHL